jgi:TBC1 domain family member 5
MKRRLGMLEKRNKALARMLADALEELRLHKESSDAKEASVADSSFNTALAKMQFVQVYLADSEIQIPGEEGNSDWETPEGQSLVVGSTDPTSGFVTKTTDAFMVAPEHENAISDRPSTPVTADAAKSRNRPNSKGTEAAAVTQDRDNHIQKPKPSRLSSPQPRPPLAQSPLSWILGEGRHRSDFVSSSTPPPEHRRDSVPIARPKRLFGEGKDDEGDRTSDSGDDGFTLSSLHGKS